MTLDDMASEVASEDDGYEKHSLLNQGLCKAIADKGGQFGFHPKWDELDEQVLTQFQQDAIMFLLFLLSSTAPVCVFVHF